MRCNRSAKNCRKHRIQSELDRHSHQHHPKEIGIALYALIGIPDGADALCEVLAVAKGDEGVVQTMTVQPSITKPEHDQRPNPSMYMLFLHRTKLVKIM
jgi:hypothetical protein